MIYLQIYLITGIVMGLWGYTRNLYGFNWLSAIICITMGPAIAVFAVVKVILNKMPGDSD